MTSDYELEMSLVFAREKKSNKRVHTIDTAGTSNLSPGTFIHVISNAPGAPGEHGVTKSSTICVLSVGDGPRTV